jgi:hypothetical protein
MNGGSPNTPGLSASTKVDFTGVTVDGVYNQYTTTALALTFEMEIYGLATADIQIKDKTGTGASMGTLSGTGPTYMLDVSGITADGEITVSVAKQGYVFEPVSRDVTVYYGDGTPTSATFSALTPDGDADNATTKLTLEFANDIELEAKDIIFNPGATEATAGMLTGSGKTYTLPVSNINKSARVSVTVNKPGYTFTDGSVKSEKVFSGPKLITDMELAAYIPAPVTGEIPERSFVTAQYTGNVAWEMKGGGAAGMKDGRFKMEREYQAKVTLYALSDYFFEAGAEPTYSEEKGTINGAGVLTSDRSSISGIIITFPKTDGVPVTDVDLTPYIPAPAERGQQVRVPVAGGFYAQFSVESVSWNPVDYVFRAGGTYTATVTLKAAAGYTFTGMKSRFLHAEGTVPTLSQNISGGTCDVTITFPPLSAAPTVGKTWYVAEWGNDQSADGTKVDIPLKTITEALAAAASA